MESGFTSDVVLIVDTNCERRADLASYLTIHGFVVREAEQGSVMLADVSAAHFDLVVLQLDALAADGVSLIGDLRRTSEAGCIVLSNSEELVDRIVALELGADDYLSSSVEYRELLARARAVLRRAKRKFDAPLSRSGLPEAPKHRICFDRLQRRMRKSDGSIIPLTTAEFNLLTSLADHTNVTLDREELYGLVYKRRWSAYDRTLDTLVAKLRRKVEVDPKNPELIKTVHGTGYIFTGADFG